MRGVIKDVEEVLGCREPVELRREFRGRMGGVAVILGESETEETRREKCK